MRKLVFFLLLAALGWSAINGQVSPKEVIYGTVRTDGYQKITKGAFWATRPEAKMIYEGAHPEGYTVVVLDKDFFVRFVDGENNQFDKNYIVFPRGEIVYADNRTNQFYSAMCGNKIEYIRPVDLVEVKTNDVVQQQQQSKQDDWSFMAPKKVYGNEVPDLFYSPIKEKKFKGKPVIIVGGVVVGLSSIGYGIYSLITNNHNHHHGVPGGAQPTTDHERPVPVITPPVVVPVPVVPGGPGGTPPSTGGK